MELLQIDPGSFESILRNTLKTLYSEEETAELIEGLLLELEEEGKLFSISENNDDYGFILVTPLINQEEALDLISIEDIFIKSGYQQREIAEALSMEMKKLGKTFAVSQIEVIINQSNSWLSEALVEHGFISSEVKLEKLLPRTNNLDDVLELIQDCTPVDRIVQVLLERQEQFMTEFVDTADEVSDLIDEGWEPVMVVVTYEPDGPQIEEQIAESNQLLNWDDYSIVYYG